MPDVTITVTYPTGETASGLATLSAVRTDDGTAIDIAGAVWTGSGIGPWSLTFSEPATPAPAYSLEWQVTWSDGSTSVDGGTVEGTGLGDGDPGYAGTFGTTADDVRIWLSRNGADNLSNLNGTDQNSPTPDANAYAQAIRWADNWFARRMVGLGVLIPLQATSGSLAATTAKEFTTRMAGVRLFEKKPLGKLTENTFAAVLKEMEDEFARWRDEPSFIPPGFAADPNGYNPNVLPAPVGLYATVDKDGREVTPSNQRVGPYWDPHRQTYRPGRWG